MRRPVPLPAPPENREQEPPVRQAPLIDEHGQADAAPDASRQEAAEPNDDHNGEAGATTRDVWRAARARRKALRAEIRRFTQRSRRRRIAWLSAVGAVLLLIGGSVAAAYSPLFAVQKITVVGAVALDPAVVEAALADQIGTPLALVDTSRIKAALVGFPLIETYALEARPPHDLTVQIVERTPVGVIRSDAGYTLVDAAGVVLSTTSDQPAGQPLLEIAGGTGSRAFESAGLVVRSLPADVRAALTRVQAETADDVTLTLSTGLTVVWGSAENSALKGVTLAKAIAASPDATSIDVTSPDIAVIG
ncbi:MAG: FtsQ-type POTRA domain-containing protein [Microbacterium sp.]